MKRAYLNMIHGNDDTAIIDDPKKPFKTMAKLCEAVRTFQDSAPENRVPVQPIDQSGVDPSTL